MNTKYTQLFPWLDSPSGPKHPNGWGFEITFRHSTFDRTPLDERSAHTSTSQYPTAGRIRTRYPSKRAAANPHFRLRDHWDPPTNTTVYSIFTELSWFSNRKSVD